MRRDQITKVYPLLDAKTLDHDTNNAAKLGQLKLSWISFSKIIFPYFTLLCAAYIVISAIYATYISYSGVLYWDEWWNITAGELFNHLLAQHNEHRPAFPRLFFILDKFFFSGSNILNLVLLFVFQFISAILLIYLGWQKKRKT